MNPDASAGSPQPIDFVLGNSSFDPGDKIEIESVTTSGNELEVGATVTVKGQYTLESIDDAELSFYSTVTPKPGETPVGTPIQPSQTMHAKKGTHSFTLSKVITTTGSPHVSFYHPKTGQGIGGVYFSVKQGTEKRSK
ncbi:hypothetical protein K227x_34000 [Rubripirellula lacrimiformis]|uniref:Uncharacterized protein n=1 Tax=Rubripirellula lacrimiformis TaxID=1930273 RepID=A0A517NCZ3_9BACT|nr:hypothetical protein [Rubripirellula lacrimiformis]QDT05002.1 hypothetical protein K227x_34000 [Rubripirellula lacrimiformis]